MFQVTSAPSTCNGRQYLKHPLKDNNQPIDCMTFVFRHSPYSHCYNHTQDIADIGYGIKFIVFSLKQVGPDSSPTPLQPQEHTINSDDCDFLFLTTLTKC